MSIISEAMIATSSKKTTHKKRKAVTIRRLNPKLPQTLQELVSKSTTTSIQNNNSIHSPHSSEKQVKRSDDKNYQIEMMLLNPNINMNTISSDVTYNANAHGNVKRIRTPAPHDVLSGRGGSVNAHPGNCQFRDWVHVRKEEYNLARSKQAKADICREIIGKVLAIGGRFLTKENANSQWWIEQDDERMMSKTSQALREGAPKIREAHREELGLKPDAPTSRRRANSSTKQPESQKRPIPTAASESVVNNINNDNNRSNIKRVRVDYNGRTVFPNQSVTPPLTSSEEPLTVPSNFSLLPDETLTNASPTEATTTTMPIPKPILFPPPLSRTPITKPLADGTTTRTDSERGLFQRSHSLAASDIIADESYEFVNPFDDESFLFDNSFTNNERTHSDATSSTTNSFGIFGTKMLKPGVMRETSMSSTSSDLAGYGALIGGSGGTMNSNSSTNLLSYTYTPSPSTMTGAHVVPVRSSSIGSVSTADKEPSMNRVQQLDGDHEEDDNQSIASAATIGLPLWDWFNRDESSNRTVSVPTTKNATSTIVPNTTAPQEQQHHHPIPISSR